MTTLAPPQPRILERFAMQVKPKKAELKRIAILGNLDDRHKRALACGDRQALIEIAAEYMVLGRHGGCPNLANQILREAEGL